MLEALNPTIAIDPAGDLKLLVQHGDQWTTFQASSKAMSMASPVWRIMLDPKGPFRESQPENNEVTFPDDDAEALLILLLAAHLRFQHVPHELCLDQLLAVCTACDKYDCVELIRPWISGWQACQSRPAGQAMRAKQLFIAWTTGDEAAFERAARSFVNLSTADDFNHQLTSWIILDEG